MEFEFKYKIGVDEVNKKFELTNKAIITLFQNTASFHSDSIHYGIMDVLRTLLTWFLIDWKVKVIKRPKYGDVVTIKTWGRDFYKAFAYMDFELYVNDELYIKATSKWVLYNIKTKSYEEIPEELLDLYGNNTKRVFNDDLDHMKVLDNYSDKTKITIRKSDLDFNNHVNNTKYFDYLNDYYDFDEFNDFRITYRKEIKENDIIYLCHEKIDNKDYYVILDNDNNIETIIEGEI